MRNRSIVLIGMPRAGKTTLGQRVASSLGCPFMDTDALIVEHHAAETGIHRTCAEIHEVLGEDAFRAQEQRALLEAIFLTPPRIIATGGGAVLSFAKVPDLAQRVQILYLNAPLDVLLARWQASPLSWIKAQTVEAALAACMAERHPQYQRWADHEMVLTAGEHALAQHEAAIVAWIASLSSGAV